MSNKEKKLQMKLLEAVYSGDYKEVANVLKVGVSPNFYSVSNKVDLDEKTPLMLAAESSKNQGVLILELLIKYGADVNWVNKYGGNALIYAVSKNNMPAVSILLAAEEVDINLNENWGGTALHWAAYLGHEDIVHILLNRGANPKLKNQRKLTPTEVALSRGHKKIAILLEHAEGNWKKINNHTIMQRQLLAPDMGITQIFNFSSMSVTKIFKYFDTDNNGEAELSFEDSKVAVLDILDAKEALIAKGGKIDEDKLKYCLIQKNRRFIAPKKRFIKK